MSLFFQKSQFYTLLFFISLSLLSCFSPPLTDTTSIEHFLKDRQLNYTQDKEGDFKVLVYPKDGLTKTAVWIRRETNLSKESPIREIVCPVILLSPLQTKSLAPLLLRDNYETRVMGNWCFLPQEEESEILLAYQIKASVNSKESFVLNALEECAYAANTMKEVIETHSLENKEK